MPAPLRCPWVGRELRRRQVHGEDPVQILMNNDCLLSCGSTCPPGEEQQFAVGCFQKEDLNAASSLAAGLQFRAQVYQKFVDNTVQFGVSSSSQVTHLWIGMTTRIFHAEDESYLTAAGSIQQAGGKILALHKARVMRGGSILRNSNRLFTDVSA